MIQPAADCEILLVGNYRLDGQMSMVGYFDLLLRELGQRGVQVSGIEPPAVLGAISAGKLTKWLRYVDKYVFFPFFLRRRIRKMSLAARREGRTLIVHVTDHSNSPYLAAAKNLPTVATCHDLLAVRGALGEDTDCPASGFGKVLQAKILASLRRADHVVCVSEATRSDLRRLAPETASSVIPLALHQPYRAISPETAAARLPFSEPFILHVGSSLKRKNREGILRIFAKIQDRFPGILVFAGENLHPEQRSLAVTLGIDSRVREMAHPSNEILEALYNQAHALLFPSKTEGFGWPIMEAQACGCPVLAARTTSLPEVVGEGGLLRDLADEDGFAADLLSLSDPHLRGQLVQKGFENLARFQTPVVMEQYLRVYSELAAGTASPIVSINRA